MLHNFSINSAWDMRRGLRTRKGHESTNVASADLSAGPPNSLLASARPSLQCLSGQGLHSRTASRVITDMNVYEQNSAKHRCRISNIQHLQRQVCLIAAS